MSSGTDFIAPGQRIVENDFRSGMPSPETADGADTLTTGWTWVAALLVAALFIVAGYLDQESGIVGPSSVAENAAGQASDIATPRAQVADANWAHRALEKGY